MKFLKKLIVVLFLGGLLVVGLGYLAVANIDAIVARYREPLERWVGAELGGQLASRKITAHLLPRPRLEIEAASLSFDAAEPAFVVAQIGVDFELMPLLWRSLKLNAVVLRDPEVFLQRGERGIQLRGMSQAEQPRSAGAPLFIRLDRFEVRNGRVVVDQGGGAPVTTFEGVDLTGAMRVEDGELSVAPLEVKAHGAPPVGDIGANFEAIRFSAKSGEIVVTLQRGGWHGLEFRGEGGWRLHDGTGRFSITGPPVSLVALDGAVQALGGGSLFLGEGIQVDGTAEPKLSLTFEGENRYRINGSFGVAGRVSSPTVAVEGISGLVQLALHEQGGRVAIENFRGVVGSEGAPITAEGAFDLQPLRGDVRGTVAALPLAAVARFIPTGDGAPIAVDKGTAALKFSVLLRGDTPAEWSVAADVTGGGGALRGVPFQDGAGRIRLRSEATGLGVALEPFTLGVTGGAEAIVIKGDIRGGRGVLGVSSAKVGLGTALAFSGIDTTGWSELAGDLRLDLKARFDNGAVTVAGPIGIVNGTGRFGEHAVSGVNGELVVESGLGTKIRAAEVRGELNGEPLVWRGDVTLSPAEVRFERCSFTGFGGEFTGNGSITSAEPRRVEVEGRGRGISVDAVRRVFGGGDDTGALSGVLSDVRWRVAGTLGDTFTHSLEGGAAFELERGSLRGVNIGRVAIERIGAIPLLRDLLGGAIPAEYRPYFDAPDTAIRRMTGEFDLSNGEVSTRGLRVESDLFGLEAEGRYEIGGGVDLGATLGLERRFAYQLAERVRELRLLFGPGGTIVVPLKISGPPAELTVSPDVGSLVSRAAQATVQREAGRFIDRAIERLGGEAPDGYGER